jgi:hypothetical protein
LLVVTDENARRRLDAALNQELGEARSQVRCLTADEVPALLEEFQALPDKTEKVAGYTVNVHYGKPTAEERTGRLSAIRNAVARSLRRLGKPD